MGEDKKSTVGVSQYTGSREQGPANGIQRVRAKLMRKLRTIVKRSVVRKGKISIGDYKRRGEGENRYISVTGKGEREGRKTRGGDSVAL